MAAKAILTVLFLIIGVIFAEVVELRECPDDAGTCTVHEVRIDPCHSTPPVSCWVKRSKNVTVSFDFTPKFSAKTLKSMAYQATTDAEFVGMSDQACLHAPCPLADGLRQTYQQQLHIGKMLPLGTFEVRWKLWNEADETQYCCFMQTIRIKK